MQSAGKNVAAAINPNQNPSPSPNPPAKKKPGKSFSDLLVEWGSDRKVNLELAPESFQLEPPNVATCGQKP